jgi:type IV pilus assembly protein PilB
VPSLTEVLITRGIVFPEQLKTAHNGTADEFEMIENLIHGGTVSRGQVASARAEAMGIPFVELVAYPVERAAIALVPPALCRRHRVLPIDVAGGTITLAMADPDDVFALDDVRAATGLRISPVLAEEYDLRDAVEKVHRADTELTELSSALEEENRVEDLETLAGRDAGAEDAPIVRFVNVIISQAIQDAASDIHIEPADHELRVRYRIDGVLHDMQSAPKSITNGVISRLKIMSDIDISERRKPQDGRMAVTHRGRQIDIRVATLPTVNGEKIVLRILDNSATRRELVELELLPRNFRIFQKAYSRPYGMVLVTGPTGSGKSTTLYSALDDLSTPQINIITVEDPVEYRMAGINQVQVNPKAGLLFASALRSILRSDPDVMLIGEIRDSETAQIAIEASLTGHMVLSTLHTNDAPSAITRLIEMGVEPFLVGSALDCVVAQRLARRLCSRCKEAYVPDEAVLAFGMQLSRAFESPSAATGGAPSNDSVPTTLYRSVGCVACSNTGYRGRLALHEVMEMTEEIERLAVATAPTADIQRLALAQGMRTLRQDGWEKVKLGLTSLDEIMRVVA